jgi:hypothetical protein
MEQSSLRSRRMFHQWDEVKLDMLDTSLEHHLCQGFKEKACRSLRRRHIIVVTIQLERAARSAATS